MMFTQVDRNAFYKRPHRGYMGDAGYDLYAPHDTILNPGEVRCVPTNVRVDLPVGWFGLIQERSSQGAHGYHTLGNVIDEGYEGELCVNMLNTSKRATIVYRGDRIAQLVLVPRFIDPNDAALPVRGLKGFGSTGR